MINPVDLMEYKSVELKEMPRYNEVGFIPAGEGHLSWIRTQPTDYARIMLEIKKCPELIGILNALVTDIVSDGHFFEDAEGKQPKQKVNKAEDFMRRTRFKSELRAGIFDWAALGNASLWKGSLTDNQVKEVSKKFGLSVPEVKALVLEMSKDKVGSGSSRIVMHVPWSTMNIDLNEEKTTITGYRQVTNDAKNPVKYSPDEIIHARYLRVDGKVYGYGPAEAALGVITTLTLIKDYHGYHFDNSGIPDWMFILPKEMAGSPNVKQLEQALKKFKSSKHKGGNLVFTGEVQPEQMNRFDKDMEYRELAVYYTGILALAWNMPLSRVAPILGTKIKATGVDISEQGYWRGISEAQDYWEDLLNAQLFEPEFGLYFRFKRNYRDDDVKEAQALAQKMTIAQQLKTMNVANDEFIYNFLKIKPEHRAKGGIKSGMDQLAGQNVMPNGKVLPGAAEAAVRERKKDEQEQKPDAASASKK